ncbi:MAG: VPLPA-CTERM sorting domain-containing protein [Tateyamaria sp.]|uniref:VPLPA-CTERM sorting domain-containing protein n=1 Tax=Tateyamaria sp. TaxID=1929288 RepID=UPI00329B0475
MNFGSLKGLLGTTVATFAFAGAVAAAPLSYGGDAGMNILTWDRGPVTIGGQSVDPTTDEIIASFANGSAVDPLAHFNALLIDEAADLEFTFIISEASNLNSASLFLNTGPDDVEIFNNDDNDAGDKAFARANSGPLDFTYCTDGEAGGGEGCISNIDGVAVGNSGLKIASSEVFKGDDGRDLVFFFFGDGAGDSDLTDLVVAVQASVVPLPAGGLLLLGGLGGLAALRRRKKANA